MHDVKVSYQTIKTVYSNLAEFPPSAYFCELSPWWLIGELIVFAHHC